MFSMEKIKEEIEKNRASLDASKDKGMANIIAHSNEFMKGAISDALSIKEGVDSKKILVVG